MKPSLQDACFDDGFDTYILLNTDGDATGEAVIRLDGVYAVEAGWFVR